MGLVFLSSKESFADLAVSESWQTYLEAQLRVLKEEITSNAEVIQMVARANEENAHFTQKDIDEIDREWQETEGVDLFIVSLITNDLAVKLKAVQKKQRALVEMFMTDKKGLLIASTNKTSDYFQADEAWWQKAFELKNTNGFWGNVEYDESSFSDAVSLYLAVTDERGEVISILKAVCSKNKIMRNVS